MLVEDVGGHKDNGMPNCGLSGMCRVVDGGKVLFWNWVGGVCGGREGRCGVVAL
jgi:hypothetical protein